MSTCAGRVAIVGGGLAGCVLAEILRARGVAATVFDAPLPGAASPVAAGILNPVSGPRLAPVPHAELMLDAALPFYRRMGKRLGVGMLVELPVLRVLLDAREARSARKRRDEGGIDRWVRRWAEDHVELKGLGRVDIGALTGAVRDELRGAGAWSETLVEDGAIETREDSVRVNGNDFAAVVLADGWRSVSRKWMRPVPFEPVKGHILRIAADEGESSAIRVGGKWTCPLGGGLLAAGASHEREFPDPHPDANAGAMLSAEVETFLRRAVRVEAVTAGVRPAVADRRPVVGALDPAGRVWCLNGLGSRGAMQAPWVAGELVAAMLDGRRPDPFVDVARFVGRAETAARGVSA